MLLILILLTGFILRIYHGVELMGFGHDSDVISWVIKDILINHHPRLIGQETSFQGVYIGPLFYYLLAPFYFIFNMNPEAGVYLSALLGVFNIFSFYYIFSKIFNKRLGILAAFFYSISHFTLMNDRGIVPTMTMIVWTVWYFYAHELILKKNQTKAYILLGLLIGLIWHINLALVLLLPSFILTVTFSKNKPNLKSFICGICVLMLSLSPLILFELRNNFPQTKSLINFTNASNSPQILISLYAQNISSLVINLKNLNIYLIPASLLIILFYLLKHKLIKSSHILILICWQFTTLFFFAFFPQPLTSYYLSGVLLLWITIIVLFINHLLLNNRLKYLGIALIIMFSIHNITKIINTKSNQFGYRQRRSVVQFIKSDAMKHNFPCVSVSHMSSPGFDLGYRYLFWIEELHVNHPDSGSPVYTIVFPTNLAGRLDQTFGTIGVVLPDYEKYNKEGIAKSCSGQNSNLTDPMFKYVQ